MADSIALSCLCLCFGALPASLAQDAVHIRSLNLSVAAPIAMEGEPLADDRSPRLEGAVQSPDGSTVFLVSAAAHAELLVGGSRTGFGTPIPLSMTAYRLKIVEGTGGGFWIGGVTDAAVSITGTRVSHGYLARVDQQGRLGWERRYGKQSERSIQSMSPLASGDVVVSGKDNNRTWLARISSEGNVVWERFVGLGKGSAVAARDGIVTLAALDQCPCVQGYREDITVWSFDQAGEMTDRRTIREGINSNPEQSAARIELEHAGDSIYVLSAWVAFQAKALEITKLNLERQVVWTKSFPKTVLHMGEFWTAGIPARSLLANGDLLFAMREQLMTSDFVLSRLDSSSGDVSEVVVQMPAALPSPCDDRWGAIEFLKEEQEEKVLLFGSPPDGRGPRSCGWIGEAVLPNARK